MNTIRGRLQLLFLPFLLLAMSIILGYSGIHWIILKTTHSETIYEGILTTFIPMLLPWIPIYIWLRPRINLLHLKEERSYRSYFGFAAIFIIALTLIAQDYIDKQAGNLSALTDIQQIESTEVSRYYSLQNYFLDSSHSSVWYTYGWNDKRKNDLVMHLYCVMPLYVTVADTTKDAVVWFGIEYRQVVDEWDDKSDKNKEKIEDDFINDCRSAFHRSVTNPFCYLERLRNSNGLNNFSVAVSRNIKHRGSSIVVLKPAYKKFDKGIAHHPIFFIIALVLTSAFWFIMITIPPLREKSVELNRKAQKSIGQDIKELLGLFVPREHFFITPLINSINILVLFILALSGAGLIAIDAKELLAWGANYKPAVVEGEWWRLLSSIMLHTGLAHLVVNTASLLVVGSILEPILGRSNFTAVYVAAGIIASVSSITVYDAAISVGASGAIFGLYGVLLALVIKKAFPKQQNQSLLISSCFMIAYNLIMGFVGSGIDNAAHSGGLLSGVVMGLLLYPEIRKRAAEDYRETPTTINTKM